MQDKAQIKTLQPGAIKAALDGDECILIDVREPQEFAREHIPGALNFPLSSLATAKIPNSSKMLVVFQCGAGKRSLQAAQRWPNPEGASNTYMDGGIAAWRDLGLPTVKGRAP